VLGTLRDWVQGLRKVHTPAPGRPGRLGGSAPSVAQNPEGNSRDCVESFREPTSRGKIVDVEPLDDLSLICMRGEHMLRPFAIGSRGTIDGFSLVLCNEN